jgi:hypothetical protein
MTYLQGVAARHSDVPPRDPHDVTVAVASRRSVLEIIGEYALAEMVSTSFRTSAAARSARKDAFQDRQTPGRKKYLAFFSERLVF